MKLATLDDGTRDGRLVVVSRDLSRCADARPIAATLQRALDDWARTEPRLRAISQELDAGRAPSTEPFAPERALAPLPRAYEWIDGSAYLHHIVLVRKARGAALPETLRTDPLVYQGGGGSFLRPWGEIPHFSEDFGIDFESEIAVVVDDVPMGTGPRDALAHTRLLLIVNDVTLRSLVPDELAKGFGFLVSKPSTGFGPVAVTPDELGTAWRDGRVHLPLHTWLNGRLVGDPDAGTAMHFGFGELIAHAARTRPLVAGSIIGSGTVSNEDRARGSSCLAEVRTIEQIEAGTPKTPWLRFGDRVEIEMTSASGESVFGRIRQTVARARHAGEDR